jgi:hypothetical protein
MSSAKKQLNNPFSTGGGGVNFETRLQALFVVFMLAGGSSHAFLIVQLRRLSFRRDTPCMTQKI